MERPTYTRPPNVGASPAESPPMPAHVHAADSSVQLAWAMSHAEPRPLGEIREAAFLAVPASRDDAREHPGIARCITVMGGPAEGYDAQNQFDSALDDSAYVTAAITLIRAERYEAQLQNAEAPPLQAELAAARELAAAARAQAEAEANAALFERYGEAINNTRTGGDTSYLPQPTRFELDRRAEANVQARLDKLADEIAAVRARRERANQTVGTEQQRLAEAVARLLWIGAEPGNVPGRPNTEPLYAAYDVIAEVCGPEKAGELWTAMEERFITPEGWRR